MIMILERVASEQKQATIVHHLSHAEQAAALLTDDALVAWMTPAEALRAADHGLANLPCSTSTFGWKRIWPRAPITSRGWSANMCGVS
jgi:hypothetical protein